MKNFRESIDPKKWFKRKKPVDAGKIRNDGAAWDRVPTKINMDELLSADARTEYSTAPVREDVGFADDSEDVRAYIPTRELEQMKKEEK